MKPGVDYIGVSTPFYCHAGQGNFLFHKRSQKCRDEQGRWDTGSGKLEFGLTPEENVLKEVIEEYGCVGEIQERLLSFSLFREANGIKTHWLVVPFVIKVNRNEVKNNEPESIDEIAWFKLNNLPAPLHTGFEFTFNKHRDLFKKYSNTI